VVVGIDPACFATMDQGGKRSGADVLAIAGHPQAQTLCSALRWLWRYEHQQMLQATIPLLDYTYCISRRNLRVSIPLRAR